jgi:hypothetical protein
MICRVALSLAVVCLSATPFSHAVGQSARDGDSTVAQPKPSHGFLGTRIGAAHVAWGTSRAPYLGKQLDGRANEFRFGLTPTFLPDWTFAFGASAVGNTRGTAYYVQSCSGGLGCYPKVFAETHEYEVQRRWRRNRSLHPIAIVGGGTLITLYRYPSRKPSEVFGGYQTDSLQRKRFVRSAAGIELSPTRWVHAMGSVGYRLASGRTIPNGTSVNSGPTITALLEFGRF